MEARSDDHLKSVEAFAETYVNDLTKPVNAIHGWAWLLEEAIKENNDELLYRCIENLKDSADSLKGVWWNMREDLYSMRNE